MKVGVFSFSPAVPDKRRKSVCISVYPYSRPARGCTFASLSLGIALVQDGLADIFFILPDLRCQYW